MFLLNPAGAAERGDSRARAPLFTKIWTPLLPGDIALPSAVTMTAGAPRSTPRVLPSYVRRLLDLIGPAVDLLHLSGAQADHFGDVGLVLFGSRHDDGGRVDCGHQTSWAVRTSRALIVTDGHPQHHDCAPAR